MKRDFSKLQDSELYELMKECETKECAFSELYSRYSSRVYMYCRRIIGNQTLAEDVFQDTFLGFLNGTADNKHIDNVPGFLLRIARNLSYKFKRDNRTQLVPIDDLEFGYEDAKLENTELTNLVVSALDLLPDDQREALVLQVYEDMSYQEIAEFFDVPLTTVRNWIVRAKRKLRDIMIPYLENRLN